MDMSRTALGGGFNRWMQHTKDCASSGSVADETATALAALEALRERIPVSAQDIRLGLANVELAARVQVLPGKPQIILDVAHNLGNMGYFPYTYAIFGAMSDKDIQAVIKQLKGEIDHWNVTDLPTPHATSASALESALRAAGIS